MDSNGNSDRSTENIDDRQSDSTLPRFAVVGHPNKGKSSVVATLAQNDSIAIAMEPGTTRDSHRYPMKVDEVTLYELIDTPGFQRPRKVLAWLQGHSLSASDRAETVAAFVTQHRDDPRYHDECELLRPIVEGAGIIYVVDGSVPYNREHEAEMNILRWAGRPSLALINQIGSDDYSADWEAALGQYFQIVRRFDAVRAPFEKHLELLRSFGELAPNWREPLDAALEYLQAIRFGRDHQALEHIADALIEMLGHQETARLGEFEAAGPLQPRLRQRWQAWQREREQRLRHSVEDLYQYRRLQRQESDLLLPDDDDLFGERTRQLWGISKGQLAAAGFGAGAVGGVGLDAVTLGHSLGTGALIGGLLGAAGSYYYSDKLTKVKLGPLSGGFREAIYGPLKDPQFGYVVLGRALVHWYQISQRNHAGRDVLVVTDSDAHWLEALSRSDRNGLQRSLQALARRRFEPSKRQRLIEQLELAQQAFSQWQLSEFSSAR